MRNFEGPAAAQERVAGRRQSETNTQHILKVMKKICFYLLLLLLPAGVAAQDTLRIMTYNVKNALGMDGRRNYWRVAGVVARVVPDVVAVQELDSATSRSQGDYVLGELARITKMHATYAPAISFSGGKYGIGILSREAPQRTFSVPLPGREERRTLLVAEFRDYVFCCAHLSLTTEDRMASLPLILDALAGMDKPVFIAGDWNDTPDSPFLQALGRSFRLLSDTAQHTYPSPAPVQTIDYVAALRPADGVKVLSARVPDERVASDHRPVVVEVMLGKAETAE